MRRNWTPAEVELLRSMYPHCHTADVGAWMGKSLPAVYNAAFKVGLLKTPEYLASDAAGRARAGKMHPAMIASQLKPGHATWNKGLRGVNGFSTTRFKPGDKPQTWQPVGTVVVQSGYALRKVSDTRDRRVDWAYLHREAWEAVHGPIPPGHVVVFKVGQHTTNPEQITADRLECIDRAELARRNSVYTRYPPEVARLHQLRGALNRQINRRTKELAA